MGIHAAKADKDDKFHRITDDLVKHIEGAFKDCATAGLWTHQAMRTQDVLANGTRSHFRELYENLVADTLDFQAIQRVANVTNQDSPLFEEEAREYYAENYPTICTEDS
jgi:hypothetical protein